MKRLLLILQILFMLVLPVTIMSSIVNATTLDATSFNPVPISVAAKASSGVPIGTVIAWPSSTSPPEANAWLDCNGQGISRAAYPELYAIVGTRVPNYQGMFLRGHGGNSGGIGIKQEHSLQRSNDVNAGKGTLNSARGFDGGTGIFNNTTPHNRIFSNEGRFTYGNKHPNRVNVDLISNFYRNVNTNYVETRPVNMAVRYLIRAK